MPSDWAGIGPLVNMLQKQGTQLREARQLLALCLHIWLNKRFYNACSMLMVHRLSERDNALKTLEVCCPKSTFRMAEGEGFEPPEAFKPRAISSRVHSTALPTLPGTTTWRNNHFVTSAFSATYSIGARPMRGCDGIILLLA